VRYLSEPIRDFAATKLVLLTGPRQVGKTTLARAWLPAGASGLYLNWDVPADREAILSRRFLQRAGVGALALDELHKYDRWKSWLKGLYDRQAPYLPVVVTGSARLDLFQHRGDSLFGRYEQLRLHPFSIGELTHGRPVGPPQDWLTAGADDDPQVTWDRLEARGGFPEPYTRNDPRQHQRWSTRRRTVLVREDLRDISQVRQLALVEHLALLLPGRVGSPLSVNALREELEVGHDTVAAWIELLERLYYCYRIRPYTRRIARSLRKEPKLYLWDWSQVEEPAARFENMVASHLLKAAHAWSDLGHGEFELHYLRDREKREVDFLLADRREPVVLIECKLSDDRPSEALLRHRDQLGGVPAVQVVRTAGVNRSARGVRVVSAARMLAALP
jgi:hypothetical protein